jgi:hypothetical protein
MADETNTGLAAEGAETATPAIAPAMKKLRAPRRQKTAAEPLKAASQEVTSAKTAPASPGKRAKQVRAGKTKSTEAPVANGATAAVAKTAGRKKSSTSTEPAAKASGQVIDEIGDLLQLEEENKRLRKTLADKLRAENADLRKRLGLN